jgi:hypothetical protein
MEEIKIKLEIDKAINQDMDKERRSKAAKTLMLMSSFPLEKPL